MKQKRVVRSKGIVKGMKHPNPSVVERRVVCMKRSGVGVGRSKSADSHSTYSAPRGTHSAPAARLFAYGVVCAARV